MTDDLIGAFDKFFQSYSRSEIGELAQKYPDEQESLYIDWNDIYRFNPEVAEECQQYPNRVRSAAEEALKNYDLPIDVDLTGAHVRFKGIPETTELDVLRSDQLNELIEVYGTVRKTGATRSVPIEVAWECQRCGVLSKNTSTVPMTEPEPPHQCKGCERQGPFTIDNEQTTFHDLQPFVLEQRDPRNVTEANAESIEVHARNDLAGQISAGDFVTITGVLERDTTDSELDATLFDKRLDAHTIEQDSPYERLTIDETEKREIHSLSEKSDIYQTLIDSFAPTVSGNEDVKLSLLLQLFGGITKTLPDETRIRGDSHILLIGDPGTAKSRLLAYSSFLSPRSLTVSGESSTAGLTATASRSSGPGNPWEVTGGALVLADEGLLAIDNMDTLRPEVRASVSNVIEEQVVKVSKATVTDHLRARASILAAAQPKYGRFDEYEPIAEQVDLEPKLVSQFDIIHVFTDTPDQTTDRTTAEDIIQTNYAGELLAQRDSLSTSEISEEEYDKALAEVSPPVEPTLLRKYIAYANQTCVPTLTDEAKAEIRDFYTGMRSIAAEEEAPTPVTARKLEALIRLAEASARMRLSNSIEIQDAERVTELVDDSLASLGIHSDPDEFEADSESDELSKSRQDRVKNVKGIINELEEEYDDGAPIELIYERGESVGMSRDKVEHEVERLRRQGDLYEPVPDHIRTV